MKKKLIRKPTNADLARYLELGDEISERESEKKVIRNAIAQNGSLSTKDFVASVDATSQERMCSVEQALKIMPREELLRHGLLQTVTGLRVTVKEKGRDKGPRENRSQSESRRHQTKKTEEKMNVAPLVDRVPISKEEAFQNAIAHLKEQAKKKNNYRASLRAEERRRCRAIANRKWIGGIEL